MQSDTTVFDPPLSGVLIFTTGDLSFKNDQDTTLTFTFPAAANGGSYPYFFEAQITQILNTNTTIANGAMLAVL